MEGADAPLAAGPHQHLEQLGPQHAFIFGSIYAGSKLSQRIAHLRFIGGDLALVDTDAEVRDAKAMPPWLAAGDGVLRTKLLQVLVRTGELQKPEEA